MWPQTRSHLGAWACDGSFLTIVVVTLPHAGVSRHSGNSRRHGTQVTVPSQDEPPCFLMPVFPPCFTQPSFRSKAHSHRRCLGGFTDTERTAGSLPASLVASKPVTEYWGEGEGGSCRWHPAAAGKVEEAGGSGGGGQLAAFTCAATQDHMFGDGLNRVLFLFVSTKRGMLGSFTIQFSP